MNEFQTFLNAVQFYTRIPLGNWVKYTPERLENSVRYFPMIGLIVGAPTAGAIIGLESVLGIAPAIIIGLILGVLFTGALHEDGLADCCDGFGGGWTKEKVLLIMKDSTIGAYGAIGLVLLFALKIAFLLPMVGRLKSVDLLIMFVSVQVLSRAGSVLIMRFMNYARTDDSSKSKNVAKRLSSLNTAVICLFLMGITTGLYFYFDDLWMFFVPIPLLVMIVLLMGYFNRRIGGYTGDCIGMAQQLGELTLYGTFVGLWN